MPVSPESKSIVAFSTAAPNDGGLHPSPLEQEVVGFFDQLRDRLLRYLLGFGIPVEDAEEIVQEAFLALFQHLVRGKSRSHLRGWLFRVVHNLALKRRQQTQHDLENLTNSTDADATDLFVDPSPNPEDQLTNAQRRRRLLAVLRALPEQDRRCLFLRAEGLRYREIAGVLDMSLGSVSLSLVRSLARIARAVERN
jgi:RNA polymerase sigma-70 factor (ECF subfamily)